MTPDRRRRLADDTARVAGYMRAVLLDALRAQAEIPDNVTAGLRAWRVWADRLDTWAAAGGSGREEGD